MGTAKDIHLGNALDTPVSSFLSLKGGMSAGSCSILPPDDGVKESVCPITSNKSEYKKDQDTSPYTSVYGGKVFKDSK